MESTADNTAGTVVGSTIEMAHELGLAVVAEGVENADIWHFLVSLGCDITQGYHIARPLGAEDLTAWMGNWNSAYPLPRRAQVGT